ncbi:CubicO group peptidase (beta-lactamase class C family) [Natranaerovirga pectinivora]|uniref:CubicO group peptidase (Beta-lactamase class C family) n=1 Tax=Natranaerovirga pectinivora TaxID=682400 RepID=A0A4R3MPK3_9FIRM|nr:serine hydrolase domain-containing protein [Natranaerovirga pectinivora]TCT17237.1 CubicO group peptidase (beta-lactamase class C family) [Natranaerovirga pectinivora]
MGIDNIIETDFSGCISVKKCGEVVFQKSYGYADLPNKIENDVCTKFATASAGKVFVAVGILQLVEQGKLHLDDTIGNILDFDLRNIDKDITVRQLLCHTSGIPDYFDESIMEEYDELWRDYPNYKIRTSTDLIPLFINKPMRYSAGEKFQYNNTGFVILGLIIEKVTGLLFDKYLLEHVFNPCSMLDTGYYELDRLPAKCANAYIYDEKRGEFYTNIYSVDVKGTGAGGAFTTVLDIERFWEYLLGGKLLSHNMVNQMLIPQSHTNSQYYGYGIWLDKTDDNTYIPYFQGCDPGVSFISSYDMKNNICITAVSNFGDNVWKIRKNISKFI